MLAGVGILFITQAELLDKGSGVTLTCFSLADEVCVGDH